MFAAVHLHAKIDSAIRRGHPWIFPKAIAKVKGQVNSNDLVQIYSSEAEPLGYGMYNSHSLYRVRVLARNDECLTEGSLSAIIKLRLQQASAIRRSLNLPNEQTTAYRLFNSEADGLSGLTIDCFADIWVIASSAYWVEAHQELILACVKEIADGRQIIWRPQLKPLAQDGCPHAEEPVIDAAVEVLEAGIRYQINFAAAQKTGLFLDQRENHQRIAALAKNKRVLDLYTYTGGFALHAATGGAAQVTAIDSSVSAILQAQQNAALNGLAIEFIQADAREYLSHAGNYDLIILDPPKLVPAQKHLNRAKNYYRYLHAEVLQVMQPGSLLLTCNCSAALSAQEFSQLIAKQAAAVGKQIRILGIFGPAGCHPTLPVFPEGNYLTAILLAVV